MKPKFIILVLLVLVIAGAVYFLSDNSSQTGEEQLDTNQSQSQNQNQNQNNQQQNVDSDNDSIIEEIPNTLEGELLNSNDKRRGNLMLLLKDSDRIIYLNTSRDFSSLIGKQVSVSIEGSLDDFRLLDITEQ